MTLDEWHRAWQHRRLVRAHDLDKRIDLLERSYRDVVDGDRNVDDKVRTLITALAFLAAAGIALFIFARQQAPPGDLTFDGRSWNAANFFFVAFLVNLILSLMSAFVALDPRAHRPSFFVRGGGPSPRLSVLYSTDIAQSKKDWHEHVWGGLREMRKALVESYEMDTIEIARRTRNKERRLGDAQGFIFVAMVTLGLMGMVRLPNSSHDTRALGVLCALIGLCWGLAPLTIWFMHRDEYLSTASRREWVWHVAVFYGLPIVGATITLAWAIVTNGNYWVAILVGLAAIFLTTHPSSPRLYLHLQKLTIPIPPVRRLASRFRQPRKASGKEKLPTNAEASEKPWKRWRPRLHVVLWLAGAVMAWCLVAIPALSFAVEKPEIAGKASQRAVFEKERVNLVCVTLKGKPYDGRRLKIIRAGVVLDGFPAPVFLDADGRAVAVLRTTATGPFVFEVRRRDTDVSSARVQIPVASPTARKRKGATKTGCPPQVGKKQSGRFYVVPPT